MLNHLFWFKMAFVIFIFVYLHHPTRQLGAISVTPVYMFPFTAFLSILRDTMPCMSWSVSSIWLRMSSYSITGIKFCVPVSD